MLHDLMVAPRVGRIPLACSACREAQFLRALSHPGIVSCEDVVEDGKQMVLVMEHLRGGQLLDDLHKIAEDNYTEQQAATIFKQAGAAQIRDDRSAGWHSLLSEGGFALHRAAGCDDGQAGRFCRFPKNHDAGQQVSQAGRSCCSLGAVLVHFSRTAGCHNL